MKVRPKVRLLGQLYLAGMLLLIAAPAVLSFLIPRLLDPPWRVPMERQAQYAVGDILRSTDREAILRRIREELGIHVETLDARGRPQAVGSGARAVTEEELAQATVRGVIWLEEWSRLLVAVPGGHDFAYADVSTPAPSLPALFVPLVAAVNLAAAAIFALVLSRFLGRPISRLADTARSFAHGDLRARSGVDRDDELGELARAFDEMAERLLKLLSSQKELLANISHELRTPLSRIHVAVDLAEQTSAEKAHGILMGVGEDLCELERLVEDVLTLARLDLADDNAREPFALHQREHLLCEIVERARSRFSALHPQRVLDVQPANGRTVLTVNGDLLVRALTNLLDNAAKYSESGTHVSLAVEVRAEDLTFTVHDRGIGIAPEDLERVGTPFFRTEQSRSRHAGGMGLGLSLARRIVEAHGGNFSLEGELGAGTTARICLMLGPDRWARQHALTLIS